MTYRVSPSESLKLGKWKIEFSAIEEISAAQKTKKIAGHFRRPHKTRFSATHNKPQHLILKKILGNMTAYLAYPPHCV